MDYEKKYKEARKRARNLHKAAIVMGDTFRAKQYEIIFPELKESENWIPKEIIEYLKEKGNFRSCWIAWLEKQGEHNSINDTDEKIVEAIKDELNNPSITKENPAWSEEDDIKVESINEVFDSATKHNIVSEDKCLYKLRDWLKSLKERMKGE